MAYLRQVGWVARRFRTGDRLADAHLRDDAQAGGLEFGIDGFGEVSCGRVGLDDGKRKFGCQVLPLSCGSRAICRPGEFHGSPSTASPACQGAGGT